MTDAYKLKMEIAAGNKALEVLENDAFVVAVESIRQEVLTEWEGQENQQSREKLWHQLQALNSIVQKLKSSVTTAKMASMQLDSMK